MDLRFNALEEFLNDTPDKITLGLYKWRNRYYEVLPYRLTLKRKNWSQFIKHHYANKTWGIREASCGIIIKYYFNYVQETNCK